MKKIGLASKSIKIAIPLVIIIGLLILLIAWIAPKPPTREFKLYNDLVSHSDSFLLFDEESVNYADFFREQAFDEWQEQNKKFFLKRDFSEVERMILMAISIREEASSNTKRSMKPNVMHIKSYSDEASFKHRALINRQKWKKWIIDAIQYSKNKNTTILIIDKQKHSCLVIENGTLHQDYLIELGVNHLSDKYSKNDHATPEGTYHVSGKKENGLSCNYKTILLNFPNTEDKERLGKAIQDKEINDLDVLTYKLSIHGNGGKGYNWTDGSIALSNENIDVLYSKVKIGTNVVIVGTTEKILTVTNH